MSQKSRLESYKYLVLDRLNQGVKGNEICSNCLALCGHADSIALWYILPYTVAGDYGNNWYWDIYFYIRSILSLQILFLIITISLQINLHSLQSNFTASVPFCALEISGFLIHTLIYYRLFILSYNLQSLQLSPNLEIEDRDQETK